jgi:hypothetical protein
LIQFNSIQNKSKYLQTIHDAIDNPSIVGVEVEPYTLKAVLGFRKHQGNNQVTPHFIYNNTRTTAVVLEYVIE